MTYIYLDTSIAVHALRGAPGVERWFDDTVADETLKLVSSRLLQTELTRFLRREGHAVIERESIVSQIALAPVTEVIMTAAEAITAHLKSLDAIHLATALALGSATIVATHDATLKTAVDSVGLTWVDPVLDNE